MLLGSSLALIGALLWALFLMSDDIERGVQTIQMAYAAESPPTSCGPERLPANTERIAAAMGANSSSAAEHAPSELVPAAAGIGPAKPVEARAQGSARAVRASNHAPTYIRRGKPEPQSTSLAIGALRRGL